MWWPSCKWIFVDALLSDPYLRSIFAALVRVCFVRLCVIFFSVFRLYSIGRFCPHDRRLLFAQSFCYFFQLFRVFRQRICLLAECVFFCPVYPPLLQFLMLSLLIKRIENVAAPWIAMNGLSVVRESELAVDVSRFSFALDRRCEPTVLVVLFDFQFRLVCAVCVLSALGWVGLPTTCSSPNTSVCVTFCCCYLFCTCKI